MTKTLFFRALSAAIVVFAITYGLSLMWPQVNDLLPWSFLASPIAINAKPILMWLKDTLTEYLLDDFHDLKNEVEGLKRELSLTDQDQEKLRTDLLDLIALEQQLLEDKLGQVKVEMNDIENKVIRVEALMEVTGKYHLLETLSNLEQRIDILEGNK